ncbi:glycosyltransferase [Aeromonas caviae]|uniref:glycosyltransferase n=1 Tax=Aeromonas caviae TaxID=648 RepID=UPI002B484A60|nr:glycosyltransferase [Aeromonas caviae]
MGSKKNILVFGSGSLFLKYKEKIEAEFNIVAFLDNDREKIGTDLFNKKIASPECYDVFDFDYVMVASSFEVEIVEQLITLGVCGEKIILLNQFINFSEAGILSHLNTSSLFHTPSGADGYNLSIVILSYNRADMTIRLLTSIEERIAGFRGQIVVFDNGSDKGELDKIKDCISDHPQYDILLIEAGVNHGVAKGRNLATRYAEKDWLFFIDNDIYFIDNPLPMINSVIEKHNALYINLPLLNSDKSTVYAYGGAVVFDDASEIVRIEAFVSGGSKKTNVEALINSRVMFSSFVYGGTSIYHKNSFITTGMFDETMFIGFEDVDFSIRLLQRGVKIANVPGFFMVHDHARGTDKKYNSVRYNNEIVRNSASIFFEKHKYGIYSGDVEQWLLNRNAMVDDN